MDSPIRSEDIAAATALVDVAKEFKNMRTSIVENHINCQFDCLNKIPSEEELARKETAVIALKGVLILKQQNNELPVEARLLRAKIFQYCREIEAFSNRFDAVLVCIMG